jgi:hypothetical protein
MSIKCKTGDIAFIIEALRVANKGLVVDVKEYLGYYLKGDVVEINKEHYKAIISDNYWIIENSYGEIETQFGKSKMAFSPDSWLEPIKKKKLSDKVTTEDELKV